MLVVPDSYIYTLKEYSDGSLYFTQYKHVDTGLKFVEIKGDYDVLAPKDFNTDIIMADYSQNISTADLDGKITVEGRKILDGSLNNEITISLYNPKTKKIENRIEDLLNDEESPYFGIRANRQRNTHYSAHLQMRQHAEIWRI